MDFEDLRVNYIDSFLADKGHSLAYTSDSLTVMSSSCGARIKEAYNGYCKELVDSICSNPFYASELREFVYIKTFFDRLGTDREINLIWKLADSSKMTLVEFFKNIPTNLFNGFASEINDFLNKDCPIGDEGYKLEDFYVDGLCVQGFLTSMNKKHAEFQYRYWNDSEGAMPKQFKFLIELSDENVDFSELRYKFLVNRAFYGDLGDDSEMKFIKIGLLQKFNEIMRENGYILDFDY